MGVVGALGVVRILLEDGGLLYLRSMSLIAGILAIKLKDPPCRIGGALRKYKR